MTARVFLVLQGPSPADLGRRWERHAIDAALDAPPPLPTTVKAALYTGRSPIPVTGGHRRGRPDPALSAFIRTETVLGRRRVRLLAALPPALFRAAPTPLMLAAEGAGVPLPTLGDLRRGAAVAPDLTGEVLVRRGHGGVPVLEPEEAAARVRAWIEGGESVVGEVDRVTPVETIRRFLVALDGVPWIAVLLPPEGVDPWPSAVPVLGNTACDVGSTVLEVMPRWWSR